MKIAGSIPFCDEQNQKIGADRGSATNDCIVTTSVRLESARSSGANAIRRDN